MKTWRLLRIAPLGAGCLFYTLHTALAQNPAAATPAPAAEGRNLLTNGGFEAGLSHWQIDNFGKHTRMEIDPGQRHDDHVSLRVVNFVAGHTFVRQIVMGKANTHYRLSGFVMTKGRQTRWEID